MDHQPTPEQIPLNNVSRLQHRLYVLFVDWDPKLPGPWNVRRYINGDREGIFDVRYAPETGEYTLAARLKDPSNESGYVVMSDTLSPGGKFLSHHKDGATSEEYQALRAWEFNDLLSRSTTRPYGRLGRMFLRTRFRLAT